MKSKLWSETKWEGKILRRNQTTLNLCKRQRKWLRNMNFLSLLADWALSVIWVSVPKFSAFPLPRSKQAANENKPFNFAYIECHRLFNVLTCCSAVTDQRNAYRLTWPHARDLLIDSPWAVWDPKRMYERLGRLASGKFMLWVTRRLSSRSPEVYIRLLKHSDPFPIPKNFACRFDWFQSKSFPLQKVSLTLKVPMSRRTFVAAISFDVAWFDRWALEVSASDWG